MSATSDISSSFTPPEFPRPAVSVAVDRAAFHGSSGPTPAAANSYTETPINQENGQQFGPAPNDSALPDNLIPTTQRVTAAELTTNSVPDSVAEPPLGGSRISIHAVATGGQQIVTASDDAADPLEDLLARALSRPRRGRPAIFDEHNKGKLVALLSLGMSLRQAAAVLGVSHGTIQNTLKANPELAEEITSARFQAQLQPLACVIREARRSWKAATWLLKYLDGKITSHEETPDESRARKRRENEELLARARG